MTKTLTGRDRPPTTLIPRRYRLRGQVAGVVVEVVQRNTDTAWFRERNAVVVRVVDRPLSGRGSRVRIGDEWTTLWSDLIPFAPEVRDDA